MNETSQYSHLGNGICALVTHNPTALDTAGAREGCSLEVQLGFLFSARDDDNIHWLYFSPLVIFLKIFF